MTVGLQPGFLFIPNWLTGSSYHPEMEVLAVALGGCGLMCAWRSILLLRLAWWFPGFVLLCPPLLLMNLVNAYPMFAGPDDAPTIVIPALSAVLLGAAIAGLSLAGRAPATQQLRN